MRRNILKVSVRSLFQYQYVRCLGILVAVAVSVMIPMQAQDHFKCYEVDRPPGVEDINTIVSLADQFEPEPEVLVVKPKFFCNPVAKTHNTVVTAIGDPTAHLTGFKIKIAEEAAASVVRLVEVDNQFGMQTLEVEDARVLFVPSKKDAVPSALNLDHFMCYEADGPPVNLNVDLTDQFGVVDDILIGEPDLFCNPVAKTHNTVDTAIGDPTAHLTCYEINDVTASQVVVADNQFGVQTLLVEDPELLCVPSVKLAVTEIPPVAVSGDSSDGDEEPDLLPCVLDGDNGEPTGSTGSTGDPCPILAVCVKPLKMQAVTLRYTAADKCTASSNTQDPTKAQCTDVGTLVDDVNIFASDMLGSGGPVWFTGPVSSGGSFVINAANDSLAKLSSNTWVTISDLNGVVLQEVQIHTSCSQPTNPGDKFGSLEIVTIFGTFGTTSKKDPGIICEAVEPGGAPVDTDNDGVTDDVDTCPGTVSGPVNELGCSAAQDPDNDGVPTAQDQCPTTFCSTGFFGTQKCEGRPTPLVPVDANGCGTCKAGKHTPDLDGCFCPPSHPVISGGVCVVL